MPPFFVVVVVGVGVVVFSFFLQVFPTTLSLYKAFETCLIA